MQLARFPRYRLAHLPTPLEPMHQLTAYLRRSGPAPNLWIKRDDCTGLATGGNKTRKLEFVLGDAQQRGADTLITQGAVQSNHARQTAAAATRAGMGCELLLEQRVTRDEDYQHSGNVLLDSLLGADVVDVLPAGTDMPAAMNQLADQLRDQGHTPHVIPGGASTPVGALGYVDCAAELAREPLPIDTVVHATGSAGTQAGLLAGFHGSHTPIDVLGISVRHPADTQRATVADLATRTLEHLDIDTPLPQENVAVDDRFVGEGYGIPTTAMLDAIRLLARTEGILLDPVYSGKAMAGLLHLINQGHFTTDQHVVFLHTGGAAGLFGYRTSLQ